jgi:hypothetical protein
MAITVKVSCPICGARIEYDHNGDAWGTVSIWDMGCVEVTAHDGGKIREHLNTHTLEEAIAVQKRLSDGYAARVARTPLRSDGPVQP